MKDLINSDNIKDYIKAIGNKDLYSITEIKLDKLAIDGDFNNVDFNDFKYLTNLNKVTFCNLIISYDDFKIVAKNKNINKLEFVNCEFPDIIEELIGDMNVRNLVLDNSKLELSLLNNIYDSIVIKNMKYIRNNLIINKLDVSRCEFNFKDINYDNVSNLIISHSQYALNDILFDGIKHKVKIIIKEDKYDFVEEEL